jgi:hypothetical protein
VEFIRSGIGKPREEQREQMVACGEFRRPLFLFSEREEEAQQRRKELVLDLCEVAEGQLCGLEGLQACQRVVEQIVFVFLSAIHQHDYESKPEGWRCSPPLDADDSIEKVDQLGHASLGDERVDPCDRLVSEELPELLQSPNLYELRLAHFPQV